MSTDLAALRDRVASAWRGDIIDTLSQYTCIECLSPVFDPDWHEHGHLERAAHLLAAWCRSRPVPGLTAEVIQLEGLTPTLLVEIPGGDSGSAGGGGTGNGTDGGVLVYGHMDKQPPQGEWRPGLGPFLPVRDGDRLYGRGTADDGYSVFAALAAVEALQGDHGRVTILIEASEESGSPHLDAYLEALADRIGRPDLVLCLDSACLTYDRIWLTSSLRGAVCLSIRVDVLTEGVHSGLAGGVVPSSFRILRSLLSRIEDEQTGALLLPELQAEIPEAHRARLTAVAQAFPEAVAGDLPVVDGLELSGADATERLIAKAWKPALAFTGIDGVPSVQGGGNVLRPFTTGKISVRIPPSTDAAAAAAALQHALSVDPPQGARITIELEPSADGWVAPEPEPWLAEALNAASLTCFGTPSASYGEGGSIPFLATLSQRFPGVQLVATGVLGPHSNAHGPNEFLHLPMAEAVTVAVGAAVSAAPR